MTSQKAVPIRLRDQSSDGMGRVHSPHALGRLVPAFETLKAACIPALPPDARMPAPKPIDAPIATLLTLCCAIWGVGLVMVKIANTDIPPVLQSGLRSICAGGCLLLWAWVRGIKLFTRDGSLGPGLLCGVIFALEFMVLYVGLNGTPAARATIFLHCAPFVAAAGEHFLVPGHRLTRARVAGLLVAFVGLLVALGEAASGPSTLTGDLLCLAGGVFWGLTTVVIRATKLREAPPEKALLMQLAFSAPIMIAGALLLGERVPATIGAPAALAFAYTVLLTVVFGYSMWFWMMRTYSAASLHAFTFLTPIFGALAGAAILGERPGLPTVIGLLLVVVGIYLVNRPARTPAAVTASGPAA
jgi:drug/metabolite transporter (DMT)-like permease